MNSAPDTPDPSSIRLLLLQFLFFDDPLRQDRTEFYPFLLGQASALGVAAEWLHCGVYSYETSHQNAHRIHIDDVETRHLVDGIRSFGPTHLLVPDLLDDGVEAAIRSAFPGLVLLGVHDQPVEVQKLPTASWLPGLLGLPTSEWDGRFLVDAVPPQYHSRLIPAPPGYEAPAPDLLPVICGPSCVYSRPIARNPMFEGVTFSERVLDLDACSFCARAGGRKYVYETPPMDLALKQCLAAGATRDKYFADVYRIRGAAVAMKIGAFLKEIVQHPMPPSEFCFEFRVDEILKVARAVDEALPLLAQAGHRLNFYNTGLENFSVVEQERYNKGITTEQVFETVDLVQRWRREYPDTFEFGNYGLVVFSPWTTLDDVQANLDGVQRLRDAGIHTGVRHIASKMQMFREIALYDLAVHDGVEFLDVPWEEGVVVDPETGFVWFDGHAKGSANAVELPWRFLHEEAAIFYELVWRACLAGEVDDRAREDPLFQDIMALVASREDAWRDGLGFLHDALTIARSTPAPRSAREIFDRVVASLPELPAEEEEAAPPEPRTAAERLLVDRADRLRFALSNLETAPKSPLPGWRMTAFTTGYGQGAHEIEVSLEKDGERLALRLRPGDVPDEAFVTCGSVKVTHDPATPITTQEIARGVRRLCAVLDYYLTHG